jgi:hypothetical protein
MNIYSRLLVAILGLFLSTGVAPAQHTYSKAVQKACAKDYKQHCGQYGVETEALRIAWIAQGKG